MNCFRVYRRQHNLSQSDNRCHTKVPNSGPWLGTVYNHRDDSRSLWGVRRVPHTHQTDPQKCLRCRAAPMSLTSIEEEYPGYKRRVFECLVCGETMTQWAGVSRPSD